MIQTSLLICDQTAVSGSRPGGKEESRAGEDQEPEEKVQKENPREHSETETDQEKTDEKGYAGYSVKTAVTHVYTMFYYCTISVIF